MMKKCTLNFAIVVFLLSCCLEKTSFAQTYCIPSGAGDTWSILNFSTTGGTTNISNLANGYSTLGYGDFTTMTVTVDQGNSFTIAASAGALTSFTYKWAVWVDWNNDGDFDDPGEEVYSYLLSTGTNAMSATISVPATATVGNKRLRIRNLRDYNTQALVPCGNLPGGETEDYTLAVTSSGPVCDAPTVATVTSITATTASLNWTQAGAPAQWQIKYGPTGFNVNTGGTSIYTATKPYTLNPPLTPATTYDYYVRAVCGANDTSAWSSATTFTTICVAPTVTSVKDSFVCGSGPVTLEATASGSAVIKWYAAATGGTALFTGNTFITPSISANTTYYVSAVSDTCQSSPRQVVHALVHPKPIVNLGNDTAICSGDQIVLNAGNPGLNYLWSTGANSQTITVNAAATYTVTVTSTNNCQNSDAIVVSILPLPTVDAFNTIDLSNEYHGKMQFNPVNPQNVTAYDWDFGDGSIHATTASPIHVYTSNGTFTVILKVLNDCGESQVSFTVTVQGVGIAQLRDNDVDFTLYPNPSNIEVVITNGSDHIQMQHISIVNVLGAVVYENATNANKVQKIDISKFASGLYTARILTNKGFVVKKFEVIK